MFSNFLSKVNSGYFIMQSYRNREETTESTPGLKCVKRVER